MYEVTDKGLLCLMYFTGVTEVWTSGSQTSISPLGVLGASSRPEMDVAIPLRICERVKRKGGWVNGIIWPS